MKPVTQWFGPDEKPVHAGVYERDYGDDVYYCWWNGETWGVCSLDISRAYRFRIVASGSIYLPWRGLADKPEQEGE
jgi:hypothetical protein